MNLAKLIVCLEHNMLCTRQVAALLFISQHQKIDFKEIAQTLKLRPSATSRVVSALKKLHLIEREKSEDDGRKVFCFLTDQGRELVNRIAG